MACSNDSPCFELVIGKRWDLVGRGRKGDLAEGLLSVCSKVLNKVDVKFWDVFL